MGKFKRIFSRTSEKPDDTLHSLIPSFSPPGRAYAPPTPASVSGATGATPHVAVGAAHTRPGHIGASPRRRSASGDSGSSGGSSNDDNDNGDDDDDDWANEAFELRDSGDEDSKDGLDAASSVAKTAAAAKAKSPSGGSDASRKHGPQSIGIPRLRARLEQHAGYNADAVKLGRQPRLNLSRVALDPPDVLRRVPAERLTHPTTSPVARHSLFCSSCVSSKWPARRARK